MIEDFSEINEELIEQISALEPFGNGNSEPILKIAEVTVVDMRRMGADDQHVKLSLRDATGTVLQMIAFNAEPSWFLDIGEMAAAWFHPMINEWQGRTTVEGRLVNLEVSQIL